MRKYKTTGKRRSEAGNEHGWGINVYRWRGRGGKRSSVHHGKASVVKAYTNKSGGWFKLSLSKNLSQALSKRKDFF